MRFIVIVMSLLVFLMTTTLFSAEKEKEKEKDFVYDGHGKRDPFWSLVTPAGVMVSYDSDISISDLVLEGIISDANGQNLPIINGAIVKTNDKVGLFVIDRIEQNKVILLKGQENFVLKIKKED